MKKSNLAKILEITSYPPPRSGWGVRVFFVRKYLQEMGHTCQVLNLGPSRKIKSPEYLDIQSGMDFVKKVFWHARNGYLIHTHLNGDSHKGLVLALIAEFIAMIWGCGSVLTFHAGPIQLFFPKDRSRLLAPFYALAFSLPRKIICNNQAVKDNICSYNIPEDKVIPIPAFSVQYLDYVPVALSEEMEDFIKQHDFVIASYFFPRPEFYIKSMLEAIKRLTEKLPDMGLILIGGATRTDAVFKMVSDMGISQQTYHAGDLSHDAFMSLLKKSQIYLRTPKKDGVCSSVLESLSLKTPVVASENGSRPPTVITFETDNANDIFETLLSAAQNYEAVLAQTRPPKVENTVKEEADLLVQFSK